jgi:hypothetical protein
MVSTYEADNERLPSEANELFEWFWE